ncbi:hypothetical protein CPAR01_06377 [Colletotrichum paranaense]|uniref:Uncharacterized protein n=4 Tax=Colletotrichum acutatum species complex TaxID=2707335 RepID=A0AAJ0E2W9_9PEZI|nr:uncharacterized protein CCOS01_05187 [Colletotrichum costaricense]XP_060349523.1 uncharacterized protein CPAR01_06377 [Colletotrichum paranaense]XP_060378153.1 uncharacterized protein CTAM01_11130 [Colletotrichum tamarilloi]XP_060393460.1 uncharacterized protein CABS01_14221 [Colletotrichum abscissum]KAK1468314.1 hypothetical protein CMEL01_00081 [Colletotrichum melonis]KAK1481133.1 hypothetical protein CABS01_14221 [Colletotrichum abscissum]KAK1489175.1 hypothetical protein CTAM01_11130 [
MPRSVAKTVISESWQFPTLGSQDFSMGVLEEPPEAAER